MQEYIDKTVFWYSNIPSIDYNKKEKPLFLEYNYAVSFIPTWSFMQWKKSYPDDWKNIGFCEIPSGTKKANILITVGWGISKKTKHPKESAKVVNYLVNVGQEVFVRDFGVASSVKTIAAKDAEKTPFYNSIKYGILQDYNDVSDKINYQNFSVFLQILGYSFIHSYYNKLGIVEYVPEVVKDYNDLKTNSVQGYYDRKTKEYKEISKKKALELVESQIKYMNEKYFAKKNITTADFWKFIGEKYPYYTKMYKDFATFCDGNVNEYEMGRLWNEYKVQLLEEKLKELMK